MTRLLAIRSAFTVLFVTTLALAACQTNPTPGPVTPQRQPTSTLLPVTPQPRATPTFIPRQPTLVPPTISPAPPGEEEPTATPTPVFTGAVPVYFWPGTLPSLGEGVEVSGQAMGIANLRAGAQPWYGFSIRQPATGKMFSIGGGRPPGILLDFPHGQPGETESDITVRGRAAKLYRWLDGGVMREWITFDEPEGMPVVLSGAQLAEDELQRIAESLQPLSPQEFLSKLEEAGVFMRPTITAEVRADGVTIDVRGINWPPDKPVRLVVVPLGTKQVQTFTAEAMPDATGAFQTTMQWQPAPGMEVLAVVGNDEFRAIAPLPNP
jgi:hypothetical protein